MAKHFLLAGDVARILNLTPAAVRAAVRAKRLAPVAVTVRGVRLFEQAEVERYREARARAALKRARQLLEPSGNEAFDAARSSLLDEVIDLEGRRR